MSDLISRQAAIEAVHKTIYGFFDIVGDDSDEPFTKEEERFLVINKAITTRIKSLPSAQPEIIRCRDCKHYDPYDSEEAFYCYEGIDGCYPNDFCSYAERRTDE